MQTRNDARLAMLANDELHTGLSKVAAHQCSNLALLLRYLAEVDTRQLYVEKGSASLFAYVRRFLNFSEDEAAKRIQGARAGRTFPLIFELVGSGELHLSGVCLLAPHLTNENHAELLNAARRRTRREIEELIAKHFPRADAPSRLFRLATPSVVAPSAIVSEPSKGAQDASALHGDAPGATELGVQSSTGAAGANTAQLLTGSSTPRTPAAPPPALAPAMGATKGPAVVLAPLSQERYRLQATLSRQGRDALIEAQRLSAHSVAKADMAQIIEEAIIAYRDKLAARKFGTKKSERARQPDVQAPSESLCVQLGNSQEVQLPTVISPVPVTSAAAVLVADTSDANAALLQGTAHSSPDAHAPEQACTRAAQPCATIDKVAVVSPKASNSRYIPRALRREVAERDDFRCTFVSDEGLRCDCRRRLEFHHLVPFSHGGPTTAEMLTLRCRVHHSRQTKLDFGEAKIAAAIAARKACGQRRFEPADLQHSAG